MSETVTCELCVKATCATVIGLKSIVIAVLAVWREPALKAQHGHLGSVQSRQLYCSYSRCWTGICGEIMSPLTKKPWLKDWESDNLTSPWAWGWVHMLDLEGPHSHRRYGDPFPSPIMWQLWFVFAEKATQSKSVLCGLVLTAGWRAEGNWEEESRGPGPEASGCDSCGKGGVPPEGNSGGPPRHSVPDHSPHSDNTPHDNLCP